MSEVPQFHVVVKDPPMLRALLLCAHDPETAAEISRAYYGCLEGRKASPFVMLAVLLSAIGNAILVRLDAIASQGGNGISPVKSDELKAELVKAIRERGGENKHLDAFLDQWAGRQAWKQSRPGRIKHWVIQIGLLPAIALAFVAIGYAACWFQLHAEFDARLDRLASERQASAAITDHLVKRGEINKPGKQLQQ